jgi:hypothetical protein
VHPDCRGEKKQLFGYACGCSLSCSYFFFLIFSSTRLAASHRNVCEYISLRFVCVYGGGAHVAKSAASFLVLSQIQIDQPPEPSHSLRQPPTPLLEKSILLYFCAHTSKSDLTFCRTAEFGVSKVYEKLRAHNVIAFCAGNSLACEHRMVKYLAQDSRMTSRIVAPLVFS